MCLKVFEAHTYNPGIWEMKVAILGIQGHYPLHSEFNASLDLQLDSKVDPPTVAFFLI